MAYLVDLKTIAILDLISGFNLASLQHDTKVDWLEMNETGRILLFRDKRMRVSRTEIVQILFEIGSVCDMIVFNSLI